MRAFLFFMAAVFTLGGAVTIAKPKATVVHHQGYRYKTGSIEFVSKDQSAIYGTISIAFGAAAFFAGLKAKKRFTSSDP
ncbi:MAG TPA: hypothetical protein VHN79_08025 [Lacunisphaera sp.]|nr:hypothetical protein [Lacunisphaera sp.]